jgi:uncharacterized protein YjbJ (UPF0337 family)
MGREAACSLLLTLTTIGTERPVQLKPLKGAIMAAEHILEGRWKQLKGEAKRAWGKLTDDDWDRAEGNRDKLVGSLQERYGWEKSRAESDFDKWVDSVSADTREPVNR